MKLKNRDINIFSMSALDLFASGMGAFILLAVISLPFFSNISKVPDAGPVTCPEPPPTCPEVKECPKCPPPGFQKLPVMDFVIVLDITGSMGDELNSLRAEIGGIAAMLERLSDDAHLRLVVFGDRDYQTPVTSFPLTSSTDLNAIKNQLSQIRIEMGMGSGGNYADGEAVLAGFKEALNTSWRSSAKSRVIIVMTDDVPHLGDDQQLINAAKGFVQQRNGNIVSVILSGRIPETEPVYKKVVTKGKGEVLIYEEAVTSITAALILSLLPK